jgi:hypothetical protein
MRSTIRALVAAARRGDLHAWLALHPTRDGTRKRQ